MSSKTHAALEINLKTRVCELAGTNIKYLTPDALGFLQRRTTKWLGTRKVKEADLKKAAEDMKRRFPKAFPPAGSAGIKSSAAGALRPSHVEKGRSATAEPQEASTLMGSKKSKQASAVTSSYVPPRSQSVPPSEEELTPSRTTCRRPQVIQRMQRLNADKEWHLAAQEDARAHAEAKKKQLDERIAKQIAVKKDMEVAEHYRELRKAEERKEREENRQTVIRVIEEVKQHERDIEQQRKNKFAREKRFIEEQRETRRNALEARQREQKLENERLRKHMEDDIRNHQEQEYEKAVAVRDSLIEFLDQSKEHLKLKRDREEEVKKAERQYDRQNVMSGGGGLDRGSAADAKVRAKSHQRVESRLALQEKVGQQYTTIAQQKEAARAAEDERIQQQVKLQQAEIDERARRDAERARHMRQQLVSSLDVEIEIHQGRKKQAEQEKHEQRALIDHKTATEDAVAVETKSKQRKRQHELLESIDQQLNERFESMLKPQKIKI